MRIKLLDKTEIVKIYKIAKVNTYNGKDGWDHNGIPEGNSFYETIPFGTNTRGLQIWKNHECHVVGIYCGSSGALSSLKKELNISTEVKQLSKSQSEFKFGILFGGTIEQGRFVIEEAE